MRWPSLLTLLIFGILVSPMASAVEGRAAPQCAEFDLSDLMGTGNGVSVDPGACLIVDIGLRNYQTTISIDYQIQSDAMDVLMFDENGIQTYKNGQNYRNSFVKEASFESLIGSEWLDWAPPQSISTKNWFIVFDNSAHDGDEGQGDQGGSTGSFNLQLAPATVEDYPLIHDTFIVESGEFVNLEQFVVDGGTDLTYWVHPISGSGDFFVQSNNQLGGNLIISDSNLDNVGLLDKHELEWSVPNYLDMQNLNLMVEAVTESFHFTIKGWYDPVLSPIFVDDSNSLTTVGESVNLDATDTPNGLGQISSYSWDFDGDMGEDANGQVVEISWSTPGTKTVTLTIISQSGETAVAIREIQVVDDESPTAVIIGQGGVVELNGDRRLIRQSDLTFQASNSFDDHEIASFSWSVDGVQVSNNSQFDRVWDDIGTYLITLTVIDPSGNIGTANATLIVYDTTKPVLVVTDISDLKEVEQGEEVEFVAKASDEFDDTTSLRFTWDLDLEDDSNNDGDATNDADFTGSTLVTKFSKTGEKQFSLTVYDASNNSDTEIFTIQVIAPPSESGLVGIIAVILFVIVLTAALVLFSYKGIQMRHAVEMLVEGGLSTEEAKSRIKQNMSSTKLPMFAKASQMAGLSEGGTVKSPSQIQSDAKAAELEAIYGSNNQIETDPYAGFRPAPQTRQVNQEFAEAALAAFAEEVTTNPIQTPTASQVSGKVRSGGVAIPSKEKLE